MAEELTALVIPVDRDRPPSGEELIAYCRDRLTHYKCPRAVVLVDDLGRTAMGKVDKRALRDQVQSHPASGT